MRRQMQPDLGRAGEQVQSGALELGLLQPFPFACRGCGDCCRGREDILLSGYDLWRIARRLNLPPQVVARGYCREYIGRESRLPVLRLAPAKRGGNCSFLVGGRCSIHDAEPLACALYPLGQEIDSEGQIRYYLQPVSCGKVQPGALLADHLKQYGIDAREEMDRRWALACMTLADHAALWEKELEPVLFHRMQAKMAQGLYYEYDPREEFLPQLEENLCWIYAQAEKLQQMQKRRTIKKIEP